jgi:hypothetical protein
MAQNAKVTTYRLNVPASLEAHVSQLAASAAFDTRVSALRGLLRLGSRLARERPSLLVLERPSLPVEPLA